MLDDIKDGTTWMINEGITDPDNICIFGWSYGGYAALQVPIKYPGVYKCIIAGAAVTDMKRLWRESEHFMGSDRYRKYIKDDDTSLKEISPYHHMDKLDVPILMVHGTEDRSVS